MPTAVASRATLLEGAGTYWVLRLRETAQRPFARLPALELVWGWPQAAVPLNLSRLPWWHRWHSGHLLLNASGSAQPSISWLASSCRWPGLPFERNAIDSLALHMQEHIHHPARPVQALVLLGMAALLMGPLAWGLREPQHTGGAHLQREQTIVQALREAFHYRSFQLLMAGYFVCGFQVVFIGVHLPSYLKDQGLSPQVASYALALVGLLNVVGTYFAGALGERFAKKHILAFIYFTRSVVITVFLLVPLSPASVYVFAACMGVLWLSTVPPTTALVAQIFGVAHLSMLGGFVFFSHQLGSFMGVWLGGYLYDRNGNYDMVWYLAIALGVFAALVNLPVREQALVRKPAAA